MLNKSDLTKIALYLKVHVSSEDKIADIEKKILNKVRKKSPSTSRPRKPHPDAVWLTLPKGHWHIPGQPKMKC